jgi:hypothetical protein
VPSENDCYSCQNAHGGASAHHLGGNENLVQQIKRDFEASPVSDKLKALLAIAGKVQKGGKQVTEGDIARARQNGASDKEIHDTVLIAAAFCMYNRYDDGLATWAAHRPCRVSRKRCAPYRRATRTVGARVSLHVWPEPNVSRFVAIENGCTLKMKHSRGRPCPLPQIHALLGRPEETQSTESVAKVFVTL